MEIRDYNFPQAVVGIAYSLTIINKKYSPLSKKSLKQDNNICLKQMCCLNKTIQKDFCSFGIWKQWEISAIPGEETMLTSVSHFKY